MASILFDPVDIMFKIEQGRIPRKSHTAKAVFASCGGRNSACYKALLKFYRRGEHSWRHIGAHTKKLRIVKKKLKEGLRMYYSLKGDRE